MASRRSWNRLHLSSAAGALHLLALAIGVPAIFLRTLALAGRLDEVGTRRALAADNLRGLAALLWIATGL